MYVENVATWWQQEETRQPGRPLPAPYDNIHIGPDLSEYGMTKEDAWQYHAIINVSCSPCANFYPSRPSQKMHWIPIYELGVWNYSAFIQAVKTIDFHYQQGHRIYLHCLGGLQRSPMMAMVWLWCTQTKPYKWGKYDLRRDLTWEEAHALCYGYSKPEDYNESHGRDDATESSLEYFRATCPKNFNLFMARLKRNYEEKNCYAVCVNGYMGRLSNDRECRAPIQGYRLSYRLGEPWRKIKSKGRDLRDWWELLINGQKQVMIASSSYTTIDGDDVLRRIIRRLRDYANNRGTACKQRDDNRCCF